MRFRTAIVIGLLLLLGVAAFATSALQRSASGADQNGNQSLQLPVSVKQLQPENNHNVDRRYGIALRKLYKQHGPTEVQKYLSTAPQIN